MVCFQVWFRCSVVLKICVPCCLLAQDTGSVCFVSNISEFHEITQISNLNCCHVKVFTNINILQHKGSHSFSNSAVCKETFCFWKNWWSCFRKGETFFFESWWCVWWTQENNDSNRGCNILWRLLKFSCMLLMKFRKPISYLGVNCSSACSVRNTTSLTFFPRHAISHNFCYNFSFACVKPCRSAYPRQGLFRARFWGRALGLNQSWR